MKRRHGKIENCKSPTQLIVQSAIAHFYKGNFLKKDGSEVFLLDAFINQVWRVNICTFNEKKLPRKRC